MVDNGLDLTTAVMVVLPAAVSARKYVRRKRKNTIVSVVTLVSGEIAISCGV